MGDPGPAAPAGPDPARRPSRWTWLLAGLLLAAFAVGSYSAALTKGVSFDEGLQLAMGYKIWRHDDFRVEGANGDLIKRWATLPYLFTRPNFPAPDDPRVVGADPYDFARVFLFELGNRPESLLRQGRMMVMVFGLGTGLLVFWAARSVFGPLGGLVSLLAYVTSPHLLAFSGIVSTDMSITMTLFGSTLCIWQLLHRITALRVAASLACFALLLLAKMTAVLIFPITAVLLLLRFAAGRPLVLDWRSRTWIVGSRRRQAAVFAALLLLHAAVGWSAIWAHYGFRFSASPQAEQRSDLPARRYYPDKTPGPFAAGVEWARAARLLPQGYCSGISWLLGSDDKEPAFMGGESTLGGWWNFFPYAIWVKTQPSLYFLLALGAAGFYCRWRRPGVGSTAPESWTGRAMIYAVAPHLVLGGVYLAVAMHEELNIGHRHVLPLYPPLYVLAGAVAWCPLQRRHWLALALVGLVLWRSVTVVGMWPHYLAYFAPQVGGPKQGYRHLVDSSLDWGMDLPHLKFWLAEHNPQEREPLFLAYFGADDVAHYGIKAVRLPGFRPPPKTEGYSFSPGYYAVSATLLQGNYLPTFGPWNAIYEAIYQAKLRSVQRIEEASGNRERMAELLREQPMGFWEQEYRSFDYFRFGRLGAWLRNRGGPPQLVGYSILVWKLSLPDLQDALLGPMPEEQEPPYAWLREMGFGPLDRPEKFQVPSWKLSPTRP
jgi:4-amino-4-deoxy-L-arabinose transferase-like glycosyltransferase